MLEYDYQGTRTKKTVNGTEHIYVTQNGNLLSEEFGNSTERNINYYFYNQNGLFGAVIKGVVYYYVKDFRGDILEIRRASDNSLVASYVYDAWGNHIVCNPDGSENNDPNFIGNLNPFRYRGYYFDTDVKMYYLQTRWYDPEVGRFINLDQIEYLDPETANGLNLYAYCGNNPVMGYDPTGTWNWLKFIAVALAAVAVTVVAVATGGSALVVAGVATTGAVLSVGAGSEEAVTLDLSLNVGNQAVGEEFATGKVGISLVLDFKSGGVEVYGHYGVSKGTNTPGISYSVGFIENYNGRGSYGGEFYYGGINAGAGIEHAFSPKGPYEKAVKSTSFTFSPGKKVNVYAGYDVYFTLF